jgi:hypothetical protein
LQYESQKQFLKSVNGGIFSDINPISALTLTPN